MGHLNMTNGHSKTQNLVIKESKHLIDRNYNQKAPFNVKITLIFGTENTQTTKKRKQNIEIYKLSPEPYFYIEFYQDFTISRGAKNVLRYLPTP